MRDASEVRDTRLPYNGNGGSGCGNDFACRLLEAFVDAAAEGAVTEDTGAERDCGYDKAELCQPDPLP